MASAMLASAHSSLPTELVRLVVEHLSHDTKALCVLARTNRALQQLCEEQIYRKIELCTMLDVHNIVEALNRRRERARAVHTLKLQYEYDKNHVDDNVAIRATFNDCIARMVNLREWYVESPYDNCHWDDGEGPEQWVQRDMERFRTALELACTQGPVQSTRIAAARQLNKVVERTVALALLESFTLHSHGSDSDFWDLGGYHCLFRHPTLRRLQISCVSLLKSIPELKDYTGKKTPLTRLQFIECELSPEALTDVLSMPARLTHLTLGENVWNTRASKQIRSRLLTSNAHASLDALKVVAHSLESLTHMDPSWRLDLESHTPRRISPPADGMRNFYALKYIQCETSSFLHQAIVMNRQVAPPNLHTLRLCRHWDVADDFFEHPPDAEPYLALPSLSRLELLQSTWDMLDTCCADYICEEERLQNIHAYAFRLHKAGINLRILVEVHHDGELIPPFLHGEPKPLVDYVYDAIEIGFVSAEAALTKAEMKAIWDPILAEDGTDPKTQDPCVIQAKVEQCRIATAAAAAEKAAALPVEARETGALDEREVDYHFIVVDQLFKEMQQSFVEEDLRRRAFLLEEEYEEDFWEDEPDPWDPDLEAEMADEHWGQHLGEHLDGYFVHDDHHVAEDADL
ncbi:hypothetical protein ACEQ8H_008534 [Pleosporales sp. CAS-2024a]